MGFDDPAFRSFEDYLAFMEGEFLARAEHLSRGQVTEEWISYAKSAWICGLRDTGRFRGRDVQAEWEREVLLCYAYEMQVTMDFFEMFVPDEDSDRPPGVDWSSAEILLIDVGTEDLPKITLYYTDASRERVYALAFNDSYQNEEGRWFFFDFNWWNLEETTESFRRAGGRGW